MKVACWIISLNPHEENARNLLAGLQAGGIDASFFPAVDGRKGLPLLESDELINTGRALLLRNRMLTPTQVGCYLSHLRAVKKAFSQGYDRLCLLEDDVAIDDGFFEVFPELLTLDEAHELVRFMGLRIRPRKIVSTLCGGRFDLVRPVRGVAGTQGYIINRLGMRKLLDTASNIYEPIDIVYDHSFLHGIRVYGVEPHIIYERESESSIQISHIGTDSIPLGYRIAYPVVKLGLSLKRLWYRISHQRELAPANYPDTSIGKTKRLKR